MILNTIKKGYDMKINPINVVSTRKCVTKTRIRQQDTETNPQNVNFNGKFGSYAGIILGGAAAIAAAVTVAPVLICGAAAAGIAGGIAGDKLEDKINDTNEDKPE